MAKKRKLGHGKRYFDFGRGVIFHNTQDASTSRHPLPEEYRLENGCTVVYADTGEPVPFPLRVSEACGYVIRQIVDDVFEIPLIDEETGKPILEYDWRPCVVRPAKPSPPPQGHGEADGQSPSAEPSDSGDKPPDATQEANLTLF